MDMILQFLSSLAVWIVPLTIAIVFHEVAHGWVANYYGDSTAKSLGRLSFNPIGHIDPVGTIVLPVVLALSGAPVFGWAKPVPVVASRMRNPRRDMMIVALAGPGMNMLLAVSAAILLAVAVRSNILGSEDSTGGDMEAISDMGRFIVTNLGNFIVINIFLAIFNMIPLPPFDGSHVVEGFLPPSLLGFWSDLRRWSFPILILLLVVIPWLSPSSGPVYWLIVPMVQSTADLLFGWAMPSV